MSNTIRFQEDGKDQAILSVLQEVLMGSLEAARNAQQNFVFTALKFAGIPEEDWDDWEVVPGVPVVLIKRPREAQEEVKSDAGEAD